VHVGVGGLAGGVVLAAALELMEVVEADVGGSAAFRGCARGGVGDGLVERGAGAARGGTAGAVGGGGGRHGLFGFGWIWK